MSPSRRLRKLIRWVEECQSIRDSTAEHLMNRLEDIAQDVESLEQGESEPEQEPEEEPQVAANPFGMLGIPGLNTNTLIAGILGMGLGGLLAAAAKGAPGGAPPTTSPGFNPPPAPPAAPPGTATPPPSAAHN